MSDSNKRRLRDAAAGPGTLISQGCKIEGLLTGNGNFMINGEVDGECDIDGSITLAEGGRWKGIMRAESVIVAGTIDGDIVARGQVEIAATARISGTVSGDAIAGRGRRGCRGRHEDDCPEGADNLCREAAEVMKTPTSANESGSESLGEQRNLHAIIDRCDRIP